MAFNHYLIRQNETTLYDDAHDIVLNIKPFFK